MNDIVTTNDNEVVLDNSSITPSNVANSTMELIGRLMIDTTIDTARLAELLKMHTDLIDRQAKVVFNQQFATMKTSLPDLLKNNEQSQGHYHFEDLPYINKQVDPILADHGFSDRWKVEPHPEKDGWHTVTHILSHNEGHETFSTMSGPSEDSGSKNFIQGMGSCVSYLMRYTKRANIGLAPAKDTDAVINRSNAQIEDKSNSQKVSFWKDRFDECKDEYSLNQYTDDIKNDTLSNDQLHQVRVLFNERRKSIRSETASDTNKQDNPSTERSCSTCGVVFPASMLNGIAVNEDGTINCPTPTDCDANS